MSPPLILHVLPIDLARGAQTYARELRDRLDGDGAVHRTVTLFRSNGTTLEADYGLDIPDGPLRARGLDLRAARSLRRLCREVAPDIVVAHGGEPLKYAVLARVPRSKLVYYRIGIGRARLQGVRLKFHRTLVQRAGVVATVSEAVAQEVRAMGIDPARVRVIPNGRDVARYGSPVHSEPGAPVRLAFVGHMTESKRPQRFVEVVRALHAEGAAVDGVMAGGGAALDVVTDAARDLPIRMLGPVDDVPAVLGASDVFLFTSIAAGEGMPGVLIEAGLASLPVVTTDVPGAADVVENGATGFIVDVDDEDGFVNCTRQLVVDTGLRTRMGLAARRRCEARFSLEASVGQWRTLLEDLVAGACTSST